jgi:CubicO group peptidase (beta-lactamase class C family)
MATLEEVLAGAVGGHRAPGAVAAVLSGDRVEVATAHGDADTLYEVGSVTKVMTATLVLQHVERGDVGLDDPVVDHLPDFRVDPGTATPQITVRHLLTHASGIDRADDFTDTGAGDDCLARYVAEVVAGAPLLHPPGARWSYSNAGYSVLGRLVEVLDGRSWDDALAARVFAPLGLTATTTARLDPGRPLATGHRYDHGRAAVVVERRRMPRSVGAAGNVVATAADLVAFAGALTGGGGELLAPATAARMLEPQVPLRAGAQGLGWALPRPGVALHGGSTLGGSALLATLPGLGALAVVADGPGAPAIAAAVQAHLQGAPVVPPGAGEPGPGPDFAPEACAGRYERRYVTQDIGVDGTRLVATTRFAGPVFDLFPDPPPVALEPLGGGRWTSRRPNEDAPTVWDFSHAGADGRPRLLMVDRLCRRADGG